MSKVPPPVNEPNLGYLPGSPERAALKATLASMAAERIDIPITIGGREIRTAILLRLNYVGKSLFPVASSSSA